jgi:hypothetical protein
MKLDIVDKTLNHLSDISSYSFYNNKINRKQLNSLIEFYIAIEKSIIDKKNLLKSIATIGLLKQEFNNKSIWLNGNECINGKTILSLMIESVVFISPKANFIDLSEPSTSLCEKLDTIFESVFEGFIDNINVKVLRDRNKLIVSGIYDNCIAILKENKIIGVLNYNHDDKYDSGNISLTVYCSNPLDFSFD